MTATYQINEISQSHILSGAFMKTFLGIGSGPGIGFSTAEKFAKEGFKVVLTNRTESKTKELVQQLVGKGYAAEGLVVDATDPIAVSDLVRHVNEQYGEIEVLHYNAANLRQDTIFSQNIETFNSDLAVNIGGALAAVQASLKGMTESGHGTLLLTGGGFAVSPSPDYLSLSIGKAGIRALSLALFEELKDKGVHIATVTIGTFVNPESKESSEIADKFWNLYSQDKDSWVAELTYPNN
jgi:short-subunit dehydrogenase